MRRLRADGRRRQRRRIGAGSCFLDTALDLDVLPAVCALVVQVLDLGALLGLVAAAGVVLQPEHLEVRPVGVLFSVATIPIRQAAGPDDGARVAAVAH